MEKNLMKTDKQKGCGKFITDNHGSRYTCHADIDNFWLCPKCKPQNHSPSTKKALKLGKDTPEAISKGSASGTFNLSEKMFKVSGYQAYMEEDVKLFIKLLKEEAYQQASKTPYVNYITYHQMLKEIDKLAGEILSK